MLTVGAQTYEQIALAEHDRHWELHRNWLWARSSGSYLHNDINMQLLCSLMNQLDHHAFHFHANAGRLKYRDDTYLIPDVFVIPHTLVLPLLGREVLEVYSDPLPFVAEIWSPPVEGNELDLCDEKIPTYRRRGDLEIWRIHPFDHTLTAWHRQPDGSYTETIYRDGIVEPMTLPGVKIDLTELLAWAAEVAGEP